MSKNEVIRDKLLLIDHFDSFTYNLVQALEVLGADVRVVRHDKLTVDECVALKPSWIVLGPGPGNPSQTGISKALVQRYQAQPVPLLGVCMGHQCLAEAYGGNIIRAQEPVHGKASLILHDQKGVFAGLSPGFKATRYHSLLVERKSLPPCLEITSETKEGEIMGLRHRKYPFEGVQFHPESVLTIEGMKLLQNFLQSEVRS